MKKKLVSFLATALVVGMFTGCGEADTKQSGTDTIVNTQTDDEKKETVRISMEEAEKLVTLGEYKTLEVQVTPISVADEDVETIVNSIYTQNVTAENGGVMDREVAVGDTVNIDFEGKKDNVAFDGGTAQGVNLEIGSGQFIDGFEDGLVGIMPGETVDLNLTFPENYGAEDLAGQAVVFTVKVNYIMPVERKDEVVASMGIENVNNLEQLRQYAYDYLYSNAEKTYQTSVQNAVLQKLLESCTYGEIPQNLVDAYAQEARNNIKQSAANLNVEADTFTQYYYGMDMETFVSVYSEEAVKQDAAIKAVAKAENLSVSDEELDNNLTQYAAQAGYSNIEEYIGDTSEEEYREYFLYNKVIEYLTNNATVVDAVE